MYWPLKQESRFIPGEGHPGTFGYERKHHKHEGVDLYAPEKTTVFCMEDGEVLGWEWFTGQAASPPSPWWNNTYALLIYNKKNDRTILYGEIDILEYRKRLNTFVYEGFAIGKVMTAVRDKPKKEYENWMPSMLHLEVYPGKVYESEYMGKQLNPIPLLLEAS